MKVQVQVQVQVQVEMEMEVELELLWNGSGVEIACHGALTQPLFLP